jgi:hypothetical protein
MYRVQFKSKSPVESWTTHGTYGTESEATINATKKKSSGALMVRVLNKFDELIFVS